MELGERSSPIRSRTTDRCRPNWVKCKSLVHTVLFETTLLEAQLLEATQLQAALSALAHFVNHKPHEVPFQANLFEPALLQPLRLDFFFFFFLVMVTRPAGHPARDTAKSASAARMLLPQTIQQMLCGNSCGMSTRKPQCLSAGCKGLSRPKLT